MISRFVPFVCYSTLILKEMSCHFPFKALNVPDFVRNANSSRFGKWLDLRFSEATVWVGDFPCVFSPIFLELGPLCKALGMKGCQITSYLLEVTRVCPGSPGTMEISNILATIFFTTNEMSPEVDKVKVNVVFTSFSNYYRQEITGGGGLFFCCWCAEIFAYLYGHPQVVGFHVMWRVEGPPTSPLWPGSSWGWIKAIGLKRCCLLPSHGERESVCWGGCMGWKIGGLSHWSHRAQYMFLTFGDISFEMK